jgi:hypothetical protein
MRSRLFVLAVALVSLFAAPAALAESVKVLGLDISTGGGCPAPPVDPATRLGKIATANTYLRSLVTHDTSELRVAADVVRSEEGGVNATTAQELCDGNQGPATIEDAVLSIRQLKWSVVDGDDAIAFYLLDSPTSPTYIAERFNVQGGLIHYIEAIFYIDVTGLVVGPESLAQNPGSQVDRVFNSDDGPVGFFSPANKQGNVSEPNPADRATVGAAAQSFLDGLVTHDASSVPFATDVRQLVNRRDHSGTADQLRASIASSANAITGITNSHVYIEGDQAIAMYKIDSPAADTVGLGAVGLPDIWAATRFKVTGGQITEIESMCSSSKFCGFTPSPLDT